MANLIATNAFNSAIVFADGMYFVGKSIGILGKTEGEICFNTGLTGYQETLTDPSYDKQIITFTFPHIGNVGTNDEDNESKRIFCQGLIIRDTITNPSSYRSLTHLNTWLIKKNVIGISNIDTRAITRYIRNHGPQHVCIISVKPEETIPIKDIQNQIKDTPNLRGLELTKEVTTTTAYTWDEHSFKLGQSSYKKQTDHQFTVVAIDYGIKTNILRQLVDVKFKVIVVPATSSYSDIIAHNPDGVFLSNGPGDPFSTAEFAVDVIRELLDHNIPLFGICLGNQLLSIAANLSTVKMANGHHGCNQPVQNLLTKKVYITSQNHGFCVSKENMPDNIELTHLSLFDDSVEGIRFKDKPAFSVQFHPESSPGPHECHYLFHDFVALIKKEKEKEKAKEKRRCLNA
jgi:carbamoyl-phosphate synthase small subunit